MPTLRSGHQVRRYGPRPFSEEGLAISVAEPLSTCRWRCPVSHCSGWVVFVDHDPPGFWGCCECGADWEDEGSLQREISNIVVKHAYRAKCYQANGNQWLPAPRGDETPDYESLVEAEAWDRSSTFRRG